MLLFLDKCDLCLRVKDLLDFSGKILQVGFKSVYNYSLILRTMDGNIYSSLLQNDYCSHVQFIRCKSIFLNLFLARSSSV